MFGSPDPKIDFDQLVQDAAFGRNGLERLQHPYTDEVVRFLAAKHSADENVVFESIIWFFNRFLLSENVFAASEAALEKAASDAFLATQLKILDARGPADPSLPTDKALEFMKSTAADNELTYEADYIGKHAGLTIDWRASEYTIELKLVYRGHNSGLSQSLSIYRSDEMIFHADIWRPFCDFTSSTFTDEQGFQTGVLTAVRRYCAVRDYVGKIAF